MPKIEKPQKLTPYQEHVDKWIDCNRCSLHRARSKVVLCRGVLPADILFVGEAPGTSEDAIGQPFMGPAGKLLDRIIEQANEADYSYAITNIVGCIPKVNGIKVAEPPPEAIEECSSRAWGLYKICKPRLTVCLGKLAAKHMLHLRGTRRLNLIHPSAILRMDISQKSLTIQRAVVSLRDAIEELLPF